MAVWKAEGAREEELRRWEMKSDMQDVFIGPALSLWGEYSVFLSRIQRLHWESISVRRQLVTAMRRLGVCFFLGKKNTTRGVPSGRAGRRSTSRPKWASWSAR